MQTKLFKQTLFFLLVFFCFQLMSYNSHAQAKQVDSKEMKDTVNLLITTIRSLEKETTPDQKKIDDTRTRLMLLVIYNSNNQCGAWPAPSAKIERFEEYWKCIFDNALYGKQFRLN